MQGLSEAMAFPDFPFSEDLPSFMGHEDVLRYLEDYTQHFGLSSFIKFGHMVERVRPLKEGNDADGIQWRIDVRELKTNCLTSHIFDAVIVCNGHYSEPRIPDAAICLEKFNGLAMHSHDYRYPEDFKGKSVIVLGAGPSGTDIAIEIAPFVKKVCLCHDDVPFPATSLPPDVEQKVGIDRMTSESAILKDGERVEADTLIFCTGYRFAFPFLSDECRPAVLHDGQVVDGLHLHLIHSAFPTMSFVGIPMRVFPFPLFDRQVRYFLATLDGTVRLPDGAEMLENVRKEMEASAAAGKSPEHFHVFGAEQWRYNDKLSELARCEPLRPVLVRLYESLCTKRVNHLTTFRSQSFKIIDQHTFVEI